MVIKFVNTKQWKKLGLPESSTFITPYYRWDFKNQKFKKPIIVLTNQKIKKK